VIGLAAAGSAADRGTEKKFSFELTAERDNFILKFKPLDYTFLSKTRRRDFLLGKRFRTGIGDFRVYGYYKFDNKDRSWLGTRLDYGFKTWHDRLHLNMETRFFQGLNGNSSNHFYLVPTAYYQFDRGGRLTAGFSGYGKKVVGEVPFFYAGLDALVKLGRHVSTLASYSVDAYGAGDMIWWIIYLDF
jgi:hypothetical protein